MRERTARIAGPHRVKQEKKGRQRTNILLRIDSSGFSDSVLLRVIFLDIFFETQRSVLQRIFLREGSSGTSRLDWVFGMAVQLTSLASHEKRDPSSQYESPVIIEGKLSQSKRIPGSSSWIEHEPIFIVSYTGTRGFDLFVRLLVWRIRCLRIALQRDTRHRWKKAGKTRNNGGTIRFFVHYRTLAWSVMNRRFALDSDIWWKLRLSDRCVRR